MDTTLFTGHYELSIGGQRRDIYFEAVPYNEENASVIMGGLPAKNRKNIHDTLQASEEYSNYIFWMRDVSQSVPHPHTGKLAPVNDVLAFVVLSLPHRRTDKIFQSDKLTAEGTPAPFMQILSANLELFLDFISP